MTLSSTASRLIVFFTSASILIIEILAGRLLAPYLGVSLEVFTGIIGVILAGISVGAWLGGRAADRLDPVKIPGPLMIGGGLTAIASPVIIDFFGPSVGINPLSIVFLSAIGFFIPAALLSAVTPVVVKVRLASLENTGSVVGSYSAVGTAGAIFGTFVTGFVLIAAFPTRPIVAVLGVALTIAGGALMWTTSRGGALMWGAVAATAGAALAFAAGPCQYETTYHCAEVVSDPDREGGRLLILDRGHNSYVDLDGPTYLDFRYARVMADVIDATFEPGPLDVLSIGGGGFTFPQFLEATRPGTDHVVLEIDRLLVEIGSRELGFDDEATVVIADARQSINDVPPDSIDLVIGDAFSGLTVPWHLTTVEFVRIVESRMRPSGVYLINVIDYGDLDFARSTVLTFQEVFEHVAVFAPSSYLAGEGGGNFVIAGSQSLIPVEETLDTIASRGGIEAALADADLATFANGGILLRDDYAPVDQMIDRG